MTLDYQETRLDLERFGRIGMVEAIWGEHKTTDQIFSILKSLEQQDAMALVTRVSPEKASIIKENLPKVKYHIQSRCLTLGKYVSINKSLGQVIIISGGTSDLSVATEAELSLKMHGIQTELVLDVGVAGLHRLMDQLEKLKKAKVLIACAGMEGCLPTVVSGLVPQPVIGIPISVGYGISTGGRAALEGMLASCAPGLVVVNIDNGYGAAMAALRILNC